MRRLSGSVEVELSEIRFHTVKWTLLSKPLWLVKSDESLKKVTCFGGRNQFPSAKSAIYVFSWVMYKM